MDTEASRRVFGSCPTSNESNTQSKWSAANVQKSKRWQKKIAHFKQGLLDLTGKTFEDLFPEEVYNDEVMAKAKSVDFFIEKDLATLKLEPSSDATMLALPEQSVVMLHYGEIVSIIKKTLTPRRWKVIDMIYLSGLSLADVAAKLQCTVSRVNQIELSALRKLRQHKHILAALHGDEDVELNDALGADRLDSLTKLAKSGPLPRKS